ncbi:MAG: ABC transporter substrate-binding protein [Oscillospiraceae bacterium]
MRMKKSLSLLLCVALFAALLITGCAPKANSTPSDKQTEGSPTPPASGENLLEEITKSGKLIVGTSATNAPWESIDENGNFVGYDMDLINEIASRMGVKIEITDMSFDALVAAVQTGKVNVAIAAMGAKEERKEKVDFSQMYHQQMNVYITKNGSDIAIKDIKDVAKYKIGVQSGTLPDQYITELVSKGEVPENQVSRYESPETMILDLEAGRIEIVAGDKNQAKEYEKKYDVKIIFECSFYGTGENIAIPKNQPELLAKLDSILDELRTEGFLDEIALKWAVD